MRFYPYFENIHNSIVWRLIIFQYSQNVSLIWLFLSVIIFFESDLVVFVN